MVAGQTPGPEPAVAAVATYRYLRLAMVALVLGLAVAVLLEVHRVEGCWQTSLSGYYYTPVRDVLVGTLVAIGVGLVVIKGSTDSEDVLLNLAGTCAPFVALVPLHDAGACGVVSGDPDPDLAVTNGVVALLVVIGAALAAIAVLWWHRRRTADVEPSPTRIEVLGYAVTVLLVVAVAAVLRLEPGWLDRYGHPVAAVAMFVAVFATVVVNAVNIHHERRGTAAPVRPLNRYTWTAVAMVGCAVGSVLLGWSGVDHWLLVLEAGLIGCFAVFWGCQTAELWDRGLRTAPPRDAPGSRTR